MAPLRTLAVAPLAVVALALSACGDDSDDALDTAPETVSADAPADDGADEGDDESADDGADGSPDANGDGASADGSGGDDGATDGELPDACGLLEGAEVEALIGLATEDPEEGVAVDGVAYRQCAWRSVADSSLVVVAVVEGTERHEMHREVMASANGEPEEGIGERAFTSGGVSSETFGATGGRTISAVVDGRTLVVALKLQGETTLDLVAPLATTVAERLAAT